MNPNREFIGSREMGVFHFNDGVVFSCLPIDLNDPATDFKITTSGELIISAGNLREVANMILRMLGEGW